MKLEEIKNWENIRDFLDKNLEEHDKDNCVGFNQNNDCENCKEYFKLINYQKNLALTKYKNEAPVERWNKSFNDTLNYMKEKYTQKTK